VDVSITNKQFYEVSSTVLKLGYSDHQSQIWHVNVDKPKRGPVKVRNSFAIGLTPGGSSTVHIYTQTIHRTTQ